MKTVAKYNLYKAISTVLTVGTPIISLASCSDLFVHRPDTAISAAGVFAVMFSLLFFKDKILENFKMPSPFVLSIAGLITICVIESIMYPLKIVFVTTAVTTLIDALSFRRMYKNIEYDLPKNAEKFKHFGFIFAKTERIFGE